MKDDSFNQIDESLMKGMKKLREREVPENVLRGFSDSIEKQILAVRAQPPMFGNGIVVFSVCLLLAAGLLIWQWPNVVKNVAPDHQAVLLGTDIDTDIQVLKALGEWTEEDEIALGIPLENVFAEFAEFDLEVDDDGLMLGRNVTISIR